MQQDVTLFNDDEMRRLGVPGESGFGALETARGLLPLEAMIIEARIEGLVADVTVRQTFVNGHGAADAEALEATYIFPLPDRAAVRRFRLEVGDRVVEGVLQERGEARRTYDEAIQSGRRAAIAEEDRSGVFTLRVGNILPGERATITLILVLPLPVSDGEATFRFPLVVAPRYIPGIPLPGLPVGSGTALDTDAVPDASRITPPVLLPGFPSPVRLALSVEIHAEDLRCGRFRSSLHTVLEERSGGVARLRLDSGERLDRDFVLRFALGDATAITTSLVLAPDAVPAALAGFGSGDGTFQLTVVPPLASGHAGRPRDVVFVLDRSGSMAGWKIVAARRAVARMIDTLTDRDRFLLLAFDNQIESPPGLGDDLAAATDRNRYRAVEFLARLEDRGGTEIARPLTRATGALVGADDRDRVVVLISDGQVGNEDQVLRTLAPLVSRLRVFTLGIDRAVNEGFLRRLAALGGGLTELVESEDRLDQVMERMHERIGTPSLTRLAIAADGLDLVPEATEPGRLPALFPGVPLVVHGRYRGAGRGAVVLTAEDDAGAAWSARVEARAGGSPALPCLWARARVRALEDRYASASPGEHDRLEKDIVATSIGFGVLSRFTAFVAVEQREVVNPDGRVHRVTQPIELPSGWGGALDGAIPGSPSTLAGSVSFSLSRRRSSQPAGASAPASSQVMSFKSMMPGTGWAREVPLPTPPIDEAGNLLAAYRRRAHDLAERLRAAGSEVTARLRALGVLRKRLDELLEDLRSVGAPAGEVRALAELRDELVRTAAGALDPAEIERLVLRAEEALHRFAGGDGRELDPGGAPGASAPAKRDGFWR